MTVGVCLGVCAGAMAWLDTGDPSAGVIALVVFGIACGAWTASRMSRFWPGAGELTGSQRVLVVNAVRRARPIRDARLAPAVLDYSRGLHAAAESTKPWRWVVPVVLLVVMVMALWDGIMGSANNAVASFVYVVLIGLNVSWWPGRREDLLVNADRVSALARQMV